MSERRSRVCESDDRFQYSDFCRFKRKRNAVQSVYQGCYFSESGYCVRPISITAFHKNDLIVGAGSSRPQNIPKKRGTGNPSPTNSGMFSKIIGGASPRSAFFLKPTAIRKCSVLIILASDSASPRRLLKLSKRLQTVTLSYKKMRKIGIFERFLVKNYIKRIFLFFKFVICVH